MAVDTDELRDVAAWSAAKHGSIPARALRDAADEIDRLRSQNNRMRHLLTGDVSWLTGSVSFSPASAAARDKADRVSEAIRDLFAGDGAS